MELRGELPLQRGVTDCKLSFVWLHAAYEADKEWHELYCIECNLMMVGQLLWQGTEHKTIGDCFLGFNP